MGLLSGNRYKHFPVRFSPAIHGLRNSRKEAMILSVPCAEPSMSTPDLWLIVPAAGIGQRMRAECPKQYLKINNRFILDITLSRLLDNAPFKGCMVPLNPADHWWPDSESS